MGIGRCDEVVTLWCALQVADPHAPASSNGHIEDEESHTNVEDLMSQLNALSAR